MHKDTAHMRVNQRWKLDRNKQNSFQEIKPSSELIHGHFEHIFKVEREWAGLTIILPLHLFSGRDLLRSPSDLLPCFSVCRRAVCFPLQHQLQMECCILLYCCHLLSNLNLSRGVGDLMSLYCGQSYRMASMRSSYIYILYMYIGYLWKVQVLTTDQVNC